MERASTVIEVVAKEGEGEGEGAGNEQEMRIEGRRIKMKEDGGLCEDEDTMMIAVTLNEREEGGPCL